MVTIGSMEQKTDCELVLAARSGTDDAFNVLVERHHPLLLRYLARQTGDRELSADLAQESFLTAFRDLHRLSNENAFAAWLYGIARNQLRMEWRRRHRLLSLEWLEDRGVNAISAVREEDQTTTYHERDLLQSVLDALRPSLREALLLQSLGGFTAPEVAQIQGISRAAAERRISRAKQQFRSCYEALSIGSSDAAL